MEIYKIQKQISNHPTMGMLTRKVEVYRISLNLDVQEITVNAKVLHYMNDVLLPDFTKEVKGWTISQREKVHVRDEDNNIIEDEELRGAFEEYIEKALPVVRPMVERLVENYDTDKKKFDEV
ncbi:hypothetical protein QP547_01085 [Weeksella virosa]|uniref:hypothetical protein n=1 Tax=Weeksella virosa TaxID=1014 RepID=UPI0025536F6C|nr:hypothetical protein [Weeksella virosa]MDK7674404.1 hypothetical protein [Weeksella virosa]